MAKVRALFKNITPKLKSQFKNSRCLLLISVGQESHEGERFAVTTDLIKESFSSCIVLLYDSVQRYTMSLANAEEPETFHDIAAKEGDLWLERNQQYLNKLKIEKIFHWDVWLHHPQFSAQRDKLLNLINSDPSYKAIYGSTIDTYLERFFRRLDDLSNINMERAKCLCFEYLLEECTVLCLWPELNCQFEVYPNWHNDAIEATRKHFITPYCPGLLQSIRVGFRNAKQIKPQKFNLLHPQATGIRQ